MRTFNVRLAAILLAIGVVFIGGIYFLHGYQVRRNAHMFLEQADRAQEQAAQAAKGNNSRLEQKANRQAIKCLGWYVRLMPHDAAALERLGMMLAEQSQAGKVLKIRMFMQAYGLLERTVRQDPERKTSRRQLVTMAMLPFVRRYQDAKVHLQEFLLQESPKDPELLELLGKCQVETGDYSLAEDTLQKAIEYGPNQLNAYVQLAELLRSHFSQPKQADQWMEKLVKANPKSAQAHLLRGRYLSRLNRSDEALDEATKAVKLAPEEADVLMLAATCALAKKQYERAREYITRGIKLYPDTVAMYVVLADIETRAGAGNRDKAIAALQQGLKATDGNVQLLWSMANLLIDADKLTEAQGAIEELRSVDSAQQLPKQLIDYLNTRIDFVQGHWLAARRGFEKSRGALVLQPGMIKQVDLWIGQCYGKLGNREQQLHAYRRALSVDSSYAPAKAALSEALLQMGRVDEALDEYYQLALRGAASPAATLRMARVLLLKVSRQAPARRNWKPVEEALDAAEKALPDAPQVPLMRANMLIRRDRVDDAEKLLRKARDKNPQQTDFWAALALLAQRQKDWEKAERLLAESEKAIGDCIEQRLMRVRYLVARYGKEAIDRLRKLAAGDEQFSESERLQLWGGLLNAAIQTDDTQQADFLSRKIAEKEPNNAQIRYLLFERALRAGDQAAMEQALDEIRRVAGQDSYWLYGQAILLNLRAKDSKDADQMRKQALDYLAKARDLRGDWPRIPLAVGAIYDQQSKPDLALKNYLEALDMGERNPKAVRRTIQLLFQTQQYAEADRRLRQLEKERTPLTQELTQDLTQASAEIALRQGEYDRALEMARRVATAESNNPQEQIWLGQVLGILGSRAKAEGEDKSAQKLLGDAEKAFRRAVELEPQLPAAWVALIRFLDTMRETDEAEKAIQEASSKIPPKEATLAIAQCYEVMGKTLAAEEKYKAALAAAPNEIAVVRAAADFYCRADKLPAAEELLQNILDGKVPAQASDVAWARRQLALIYAASYAAHGNYEDLLKSRNLIEENLAGPEASIIDRRVMARLGAYNPQRSKRDEAIRALEGMVKDKSATPGDRLALARMYLARGGWLRASDQFRSLVTDYDREPRYLIAYIEALLKRGEIFDVAMYLERLEKIAPHGFATVGLRADFLCARKNPQEALDILMDFVDRTNAQPKARGERARLVAKKLDQLGRRLTNPEQKPIAEQFFRQAEMLYRTGIGINPGQELSLAVFLSRQGKIDEALELLERVWNSSSPQDFADTCAAVLQNIVDDKENSRRFDRIVRRTLEKFSRPNSLLMVMAESRIRQARHADAEHLYREVLEKDEDEDYGGSNAVAMNNLAMLLALQGVKLNEALELVNQAIEIAGPLGSMLDTRAVVYIAMQKPDQALGNLAEALADRETPVRLFHQAQAYALANQNDAAKTAIQKALRRGLTEEMLQPPEVPAFEKLQRLAK